MSGLCSSSPTRADETVGRPKRAASAAIEAANSMCQITEWESGECDIELYDTEAGKELIHESVRLGSAEDLRSALRRTLNACI